MPRCRDEEVNMRRALPVASQLIEQLLGRPGRWAAIAGRHDAAKTEVTLSIGLDAAAQVELRLRGVEPGVSAAGIGLPHIDNRPSHRFTLRVPYLTAHEQRHARVLAVIQARFVF